MAKITIVSTTNSIKVDFGTYYTPPLEEKRGVWRKEKITFKERGTYVLVIIDNDENFCVSDVEDLANEILQIDLVDTVAPTSLADLYTKLEVLIQ